MTPDKLQGSAFDAWRLRPLEAGAFASITVRERLWHLAQFALLAPSTHNTVPVRFHIAERDRALVFYLDRAAILPECDSSGRQATVSLGCALENARVAARCYGADTRVSIHASVEGELRPLHVGSRQPGQTDADERRYVPVATLTLGDPIEPWPAAMLGSICARKVLRAEYDERVKVDGAMSAKLIRQANAIDPRLVVHFIDDAATRSFLGKHQEGADAMVLNRPAFARELGEWLLANDSEAYIGMRGREFGLSDHAAQHLHDGLSGRERLLPDELAGFAKAGTVLMRSASAVIVISVSEDQLAQRVAAGQAYELMALTLLEQGYCTALHAALVELESPSLALRGRLRTSARPTVVFRVGKPLHAQDGQRPHSSRPPLASLMLKETELSHP